MHIFHNWIYSKDEEQRYCKMCVEPLEVKPTSDNYKTCTKCGRILPISDFHKGNGKDGRKAKCKDCISELYHKNKPLLSPVWEKRLPEKVGQELDKGRPLKRDRIITVWEKPLEEIKAEPLLRSNMLEILRKYHPNLSEKVLRQYTLAYSRYLDSKGFLVLHEKRRYTKRHRYTKRKYRGLKPEHTYKVIVTPDFEMKVKEVLKKPTTSNTIIKETGMKPYQVLATLKQLRSSGEVNRKYRGRKPYYYLDKLLKKITEDEQIKEPEQDDVLTNQYTLKLVDDYDVVFKKEAVKELSKILEIKRSFNRRTIKETFEAILDDYNQREFAPAYLQYFIDSGILKKSGFGPLSSYETINIK